MTAPLTRPGPCPYCDHDPVMAERGLCVGVGDGVGVRLYECVLLREWWDASAASRDAEVEALREELNRIVDAHERSPYELDYVHGLSSAIDTARERLLAPINVMRGAVK
jgi:hypothetical protein